MPWFITVYHADGSAPPPIEESWAGAFGGYLFAKDIRQARKFAAQRGLNERVAHRMGQGKPYVLPSQWLAKRKVKDAQVFHSLCWLAHLALKSGVATVDELLGDDGLVHEYAHMRTFSRPRRKELIARAQEIERRIPGLWPRKEALIARNRQAAERRGK